MVLSHFISGPLEAAFDVEAFVLRRAIENLLFVISRWDKVSNKHDNPVWWVEEHKGRVEPFTL